jgi:ferritin-like protein
MNRAFEKELEIDLAYKIEAPSKGMQKKKFFRDVEDNLLYIGVSEFGTTNTDSIVHNLLPHRSAKQCAVRYKNLAAGRGKDERFKELQAAVLNNFSITEQIILLKAMKEYREDFRLIQQKVFPTKPPSYLAKVWLILNERRAKGTQNQNDKYAIENYEFKPMNVLKSGTHHSNAQE